MAKRCQIEELDDFTQDYLRAARDRRGAGMPGLFVPRSNYLPIIGVCIGIVLILTILLLTVPPLDLTPLKAAMIQTGGLLLGGWMIVAAVRVWGAGGSRRYLGHFIYADALNFYEVTGTTITIVDLAGLHSANGVDNYNDGKYQNTLIELYLEKGESSFTIGDQEQARRLIVFLNGLAFIRGQGSGDLQNLTPAAMSEIARRMADGEKPHGEYQAGEVESDFATLPVPQKANPASFGFLAYGVILALAVLGVIVLQALNTPLRDDAIFDEVMSQRPLRPPTLRFYLLHPENTRHRDKVEKLLAKFYDPVLARLRLAPGRDPELGKAFVELATKLKTAIEPVLSIRVKEDPKVPIVKTNAQDPFSTDQIDKREKQIEKLLVYNLTKAIGDGSKNQEFKDRDDMVAFVRVPDGVKALINVTYSFVPEPKNPQSFRLEWKVQIRATPESQLVSKDMTAPQSYLNWNLTSAVDLLASTTLTGVAGQPMLRPPDVNVPPGFIPPPKF